MMVAPVPMRIPVVAPRVVVTVTPVAMRGAIVPPRVVAPIIRSVIMVTVVAPAHHDDRRRSDHDGRWDAETDVDIDAGLSGRGWREQCEP